MLLPEASLGGRRLQAVAGNGRVPVLAQNKFFPAHADHHQDIIKVNAVSRQSPRAGGQDLQLPDEEVVPPSRRPAPQRIRDEAYPHRAPQPKCASTMSGAAFIARPQSTQPA